MLNPEQQNNTALSSEDLLKHMQSLEKRIKSLEVTNRVILGLFIGTLAAVMTVGAGFAIAAAPVIAGSIVGGILVAVALAALGVTAYKYRAEIKAGFKYAAEKTVEGAKHTAGKIKAGAVYAKDSVKEGYENSVDSLKRGAHLVRDRITDARNALAVAIYDDREKYEDRSEIKEAAAKRKEDRILKSSREMRSNMFYGDAKPKKSFSLPLFSPLKQKFQQPSNSPDSVETGSTSPNSGPQKFATIARRPGVARRHSISDPTKVETPKVPTRSNSLPDLSMVGNAPKESSLEEAFFNDLTVKKHLESLHMSSSFSSLASYDTSVVPKSPTTSGYGSKRSSPISSGGSTPGSRFVTANSSGKSTPTSRLSKPVDGEELAKKLKELRKSSSGSPTPPKPLAVNLAEANEREKQQGLSTPRSGSDSGRGSSGSSTPTKGQETSLEALQNELKQRFAKLRAPLNQPNAEPVNPGVVHNK